MMSGLLALALPAAFAQAPALLRPPRARRPRLSSFRTWSAPGAAPFEVMMDDEAKPAYFTVSVSALEVLPVKSVLPA